MVKLGSSAGVGAGVDLKEKEEVKGGQSTASLAFPISVQILPSRGPVILTPRCAAMKIFRNIE
jgi:hypothetical protein